MEELRAFLLSEELKRGIELVGLILTIVLVYIGCKGLEQLKVAKKTLNINSRRDAARLAIELVNKYDPKLVDRYHELIEILKEDRSKQSIDFISFEVSNYNDKVKNNSTYQLQLKLARSNFHDLADDLESFAFPFVSKIADENIAFNAIGGRFCVLMNVVYPFVMESRNNMKSNVPYKSSVELYGVWSNRLKRTFNNEKIENLLKDTPNDNTDTYKPLGT